MNINQVKAFTWLVSAAVTAGLGYYVFEFIRQRPQLMERRITREQAEMYLTNIADVEGPKQDVLDAKAVQRAFHELNWEGTPPPPPPVEVVKGPAEAEIPYDPMEQMLTVMIIAEDPLNPGYGRAWVQYLPASKITLEQGNPFLHPIRVGQKLPSPIDYAKVQAITAKDGVTFAFDDEARPAESVQVSKSGSGVTPHVVNPGAQPIVPSKDSVPVVDRNQFRPQRSIEIEDNSWIIGLDDAETIASDYGGILAREVRHARHRNKKTGKYDGIELKEVKQGGIMAKHGAQEGDIIKSINGHPVTSPAEAITFVKNHKDEYDRWEVVIENMGKERTVVYSSPQ